MYNYTKYYWKLLGLLNCLLLVFPIVCSNAQPTNVIMNNDVEAGIDSADNWKFNCRDSTYECLPKWDANVYHSGSRSLKISGGTGIWKTTFSTTPDKLYRISFYFKAKLKNDYNLSPAKMNCYLSSKEKGTVLWVQSRKIVKTYDHWVLVNAGDYIADSGVESLSLCLKLTAKEGSNIEVWFDDISVIEMDPPSDDRHGFLLSEGDDHTIWTESASQKIFKDDLPPSAEAQKKKIQIQVAKGETEPFQIVIKPNSKWNNVSWDWSDFIGPSVIPKDNMTYYRVEYVNITEHSKVYGRQGLNPDPLPIEKSSTLLPSENSSFWFLMDMPSSIPAGTYKTNLLLHRESDTIVTIPVEIKVWNFTIPHEPTINIDSQLWINEVKEYEKGDFQNESENFNLIKRYYKNVFEHRAKSGPKTYYPVDFINGHAKTDTSNLKKHLAYLKTLGNCQDPKVYNVLRLTGEKVNHHQWLSNSRWQGIPLFIDGNNTILNPQFVAPFTDHVLQIMDTLKRQDCYGRPLIKFFDEPDITHRPTVNAVANIAKLLSQIDPNIHPAGSGNPHLDFINYFGRWDFIASNIPFLTEEFSRARENGAAWVYDNSIPLIDLPLLRVRLFQWVLWKEQVTGAFNWWSITYWKSDPWQNPWRNGRGSLLYPPRKQDNFPGPITSLRWEMMRQGLEDYEYIALLSKLIEKKKRFAPSETIATAIIALNRVDEIVDRFSVGANDQPYTLNTILVQEVRDQIARSIENLLSIKSLNPPGNFEDYYN